MSKLCVLSLGLLLCFTGCKDSENKLTKDHINQKNSVNKESTGQKSFQIPSSNQKELMDMAKKYGIVNLETLGMTLDSTTEDQAFSILKSRGYAAVARLGSDFMKSLMSDEHLKKMFSNDLLKDDLDKLKKSSVILVADSKLLQKEKDKSNKKDIMFFVFDENQKLIMFFKQYPENMEAMLVVYEGMSGSYISGNAKALKKLIFKKDLSMASIITRDPNATLYNISAPSLVKDRVSAFINSFENMVKTEEFQELEKMEKDALKGLEKEEYRKKREILINSKEYKELKKKIDSRAYEEYSRNLNKSSK